MNASSNKKFLIGQRVVCNGEIGKTVKSETGMTSGVWVYLESKGYSSDYDLINVSELPNGKL